MYVDVCVGNGAQLILTAMVDALVSIQFSLTGPRQNESTTLRAWVLWENSRALGLSLVPPVVFGTQRNSPTGLGTSDDLGGQSCSFSVQEGRRCSESVQRMNEL